MDRETMPPMSDRLRDAARAFRNALAEDEETKKALDEAKVRRAAALERVAAARGPLAEEIRKAANENVRQRDILDRIEYVYTREAVRRIVLGTQTKK